MIKGTSEDIYDESICSRLAVIESKLETLLFEVATIREFVPTKLVEYGERIVVLERSIRTMQWLAGVFATAIIGAFLTHVLGR